MCSGKIERVFDWVVFFSLGAVFICANQWILLRKSSVVLVSEHTRESEPWTLYDANPNHIWNRVYRTLYRRESRDGHEYGYDELDPLLWVQTKYLLTTPANRQAIT